MCVCFWNLKVPFPIVHVELLLHELNDLTNSLHDTKEGKKRIEGHLIH
jgi:hypothetical protein